MHSSGDQESGNVLFAGGHDALEYGFVAAADHRTGGIGGVDVSMGRFCEVNSFLSNILSVFFYYRPGLRPAVQPNCQSLVHHPGVVLGAIACPPIA